MRIGLLGQGAWAKAGTGRAAAAAAMEPRRSTSRRDERTVILSSLRRSGFMVTVYAVLIRANPEHGGDFGGRKGSFVAESGRPKSGRSLLRLDVQALDHLEHHRPLLVEDLLEIGAIARTFVDAELVVDLQHALGLAGLDHEIGELLHDRLGRAGGRRAADPAAHLEGLVGQALFVERRHVWQLLHALECRHGDHLDRALLQEGQLRGVAAGRGLHVARGHVLPHRPFAAIVHGLQFEAVVLVQRFRHHVGKRADAVGGGRNLAVLGPGMELRDVLHRNVLVDRRRQMTGVEPGDEVEILVGIVGQLFEQNLVLHHRRRVGEHQRVAVGGCLLHRLGTNRARGTGLVLDHHRLAELRRDVFAVGAGENVSEAARRVGADDLDRLAGPRLGDGGRRQHGSRRSDAQKFRRTIMDASPW